MKNAKQSRAEIVLINLEWFARELLQAIDDTPATPRAVAGLILDTMTQLREIRKSYEPARPLMRRGV